MVNEREKREKNKIAQRARRDAMEEAKRAGEREKNAEAMRATRALLTGGEIQASQAVNTKKHMASYTALDPDQLQQKNLERVKTDKKIKLEQVENHPAISKFLKRPRMDDSSDDSSNGSIGANDASGSKKIHSSILPRNIISNSSIIITPIIKPANPSSSLTTLLTQSSPLALSTKQLLDITVDLFSKILDEFLNNFYNYF